MLHVIDITYFPGVKATSFPGSLFSASLGRWKKGTKGGKRPREAEKRDPGNEVGLKERKRLEVCFECKVLDLELFFSLKVSRQRCVFFFLSFECSRKGAFSDLLQNK